MGVNNLKSTIITNRDAVPKIITDSYVSGGPVLESEGYVAPLNGDSIGSTYRLCQVPSNARVTSVLLQCTAITSAAANIGVYYPTFIPLGATLTPSLAGTVISASLFGSAQSLATAITTPSEVINQSGNNGIANQELCLWQAAGLSADPGIFLDIVATLTAATTAAGTVGLKVKYVP